MSEGNNTTEDKVRLRTIFRLSNNQTKLLFQSRQVLKIAIPVPPEIQADETEDWTPRRIVGLSLPMDHESCTDAEFQSLLVVPPKPPGQGEQSTKGTQGVLGRIVDDEEYKTLAVVANTVDCVVATFHPPFMMTLGEQPLKWPGKIYVDKVEVNGQASTKETR